MPEEVRVSLKFVLAERVDDVFQAALVSDERKQPRSTKKGKDKQ